MRVSVKALVLASAVAGGLLLSPVAHGQGPAFVKETAANLPGYNIFRPADLARRARPAPVIVWANGGCAPVDGTWAPLFERWAAEGYVTITFSPGLPAGTVVTPAPAAAPAQTAAPGRGGAPQIPGGATPEETAIAQGKAIDWVEKETRARGSPYAGKLDVSHVVAAGNSCGGISSLALASRDKRPKAVFILSGSSIGPGQQKPAVEAIMGKVAVPTIWVVGGPEDMARPSANMDYESLPAGVPAVVVERVSGDHRTVSTDPAILRDAAEIGLVWFKASLDKDAAAITTVTTKVCAQCDAKTWSVKSKNLARR